MADASYFSKSRMIWRPADTTRSSQEALRRMINLKHNLDLKNYHELHDYSVNDYAFWEDLWQYLRIIYSVAPQKVLEEGRTKEIPVWFPGARLNYAENVLCRNDDSIAITTAKENGEVRHYSSRELRQLVRHMAAAMRANGLTVGDRVTAVVSNSIHAAIIALAATSIGAIYSSTAPDMGAQGILGRYQQIGPKFLFFETEVVYAGKAIDMMPKVAEVADGLRPHGLERVILLPSVESGKEVTQSDVALSCSLSAFLARDDGRELTFEQLPFNHPLYILYSSGTSGPPKCIIHSAGGTLLQNKKDAMLGYEIGPNDTYFQFTTTGWVLWPFLISTISSGARIILYDGSPFHPDVRHFLKFISDQKVTVWGTSPRFLSEVQGLGTVPAELYPYDALRLITCVGAVLTAPMFEWTQRAFNPSVPLTAPTGATDVSACWMTWVSSMPIYAGEIQAKCLGMKVEIYDEAGNNIEDTGVAGELVCPRPHPSLPLGFWGDASGEKFMKTYYEKYPGVFLQGDFVVKNPKTKGFIMLGRSDGVLNPSGVRFGSAEIYGVMERFTSDVEDSLCVGQRRPEDKNERVLLFLKMRPGHVFTRELVEGIRSAIRNALSPRHVPAYIFEISDIPYTVNGKKVEIAVKQIVSGHKLKPSGTVANPESLQLYYKFIEIEKFANGVQTSAKL